MVGPHFSEALLLDLALTVERGAAMAVDDERECTGRDRTATPTGVTVRCRKLLRQAAK